MQRLARAEQLCSLLYIIVSKWKNGAAAAAPGGGEELKD